MRLSQLLTPAVVVGACILVSPEVGWARTVLGAELNVGGGLNNSLFRLAAQLPPDTSTRDTFWQVRPRFDMRVEPSYWQRLDLSYQAAYRDFTRSGNGWVHGHLLDARYAAELTRTLSLEATLSGGLEQYSAVKADYRVAAAGLGPAWQPTNGARLGFELEGQWIDSDALTGGLFGAMAHAQWTSSNIEVGVVGRGRTDGAGYGQFSGLLFASKRLGSVRIATNVGAGTVNQGDWLTWSGAVELPIGEAWHIAARYQGSLESYEAMDAALMAHNASLALRYTWQSIPLGPAVILKRAKYEPPRGPSEPGFVLTVKTAVDAKTVSILGDFNAWQADGVALTLLSPGVWQVRLELSPGRYAYQVRVDGVLSTPVDATAYAVDGFGGRNSLLIIGSGSGGEIVRCNP